MTSRTPMPIRIFKALAVLAVSLYAFHAFNAGTDDVARPIAPDPASTLPAACWTGEAPADVDLPGTVLIDTTDGPKRVDRVDEAMDQVFNGVDHHLAIIAFCR